MSVDGIFGWRGASGWRLLRKYILTPLKRVLFSRTQ
jgi:hypothetical protein